MKYEALHRAIEYLANNAHISDNLRLQLLRLAEKQAGVRVIPRGAGEPLAPIPPEVEISERDAEDAANDWDNLMPDFAGMLNAEIINRERVQ